MKPPPALKFIYPGGITQEAGVYRVMHVNQHKPNGEIFLDRGIYLPDCRDCNVKYALIRSTSFNQHISNAQQSSD